MPVDFTTNARFLSDAQLQALLIEQMGTPPQSIGGEAVWQDALQALRPKTIAAND